MKSVRIGLLILAATTLSTASGAEEMNAPTSQWHSAIAATPSPTYGAQPSGNEREVAPQLAQSTAPSAQATAATQKSAESPKKTVGEPNNSTDDPNSQAHETGPMANVVNDAAKARPLRVADKWRLFYRQTYAPFHLATAVVTTGISQARDEYPDYGQGTAGYAKRFGAGIADNYMGSFFGAFALPSLLHDDPRYFRKGSGTLPKRLLHSVKASVIARRDDGSHHPNYSNVVGNLIGCAIGNVYYPQNDRTVGATIERGFTSTASGAVGNVFREFWPDIHDKVFNKHKLPDVKDGK